MPGEIVTDPKGTLFAHPHPARGIWDFATEYTAQQTDAVVKPAPGIGLALFITDIAVYGNGGVIVSLEENGTVLKFRYYAASGGDGVARSYRVPKKLAENASLLFSSSSAVTVFVEVHGYTQQA